MRAKTPPPWSPSEHRILTQTKRRWRQVAPWRTPLLSPTKAREISFLEPPPWAGDFRDALIAAPVPYQIVIIDDVRLGGGPVRWNCIEWLPDWSIVAGIVGGPVWRNDYEQAVLAAKTFGHVAIVETAADHLAAWISAFAGRCRVLGRDHRGAEFDITAAEGRGATA